MRRAHCQFWPLLVLVVGLLTGCSLLPRAVRPPQTAAVELREAHNLRVFDRAADLVQWRFYDAHFQGVDWAAARARYRPLAAAAADDLALYSVINELFGELNSSHTAAIPPQQAREMKTQQAARVGLRHRRVEGRWVVQEVLPGSPAEIAGVQPGWLVVAMNGKSLDEARLRVNDGDLVEAEFLDHDEQPRSVIMTARLISMRARREARLLENDVLYLRFDEFDRTTRRWLGQQLRQHAKVPAVVIDLRNNPGGQALSLVIALGEFFPKRVDLGTFITRTGRENEIGSILWGSARYAGQVAVLVDRATASSGEIFAHVLKHHDRALVVGRKTSGAVIASRFYTLPDGGRVQVAVMDYRGLDGSRLEATGVEPHLHVPLRLAELRANVDSDLQAALAALESEHAVRDESEPSADRCLILAGAENAH